MEFQAWINGTWQAENEVRLPLDDAMVTHGAGLVEVLRTWNGRPVFLNRHLDRFIESAREMDLHLPLDREALVSVVHEYLGRQPLAMSGQDRHVVLLATPGAPGQPVATLIVHGRALQSALHREFKEKGAELRRSPVKALPPETIPARWKHRSRLHWYLAGRQSGGLALLETPAGIVTETAIGHVVMVAREMETTLLVTPPTDLVLPGITLGVLQELAHKRRYGWTSRPFGWDELAKAAEVLLVGSGFGIAGVSRVCGAPLPWPGPVTMELAADFNSFIGIPTG
ncbi:MAG: aminotransferase class IV [Planctomycetota bacterium]